MPIAQAISLGDILTYGGVGMVIVGAMRSIPVRREDGPGPETGLRMSAAEGTVLPQGALVSADSEAEPDHPTPRRSWRLQIYELVVAVPIIAYIVVSILRDPADFRHWEILIWIAAIAAVELMPVPDDDVERHLQSEFPDRTLGRLDLPRTGRRDDRADRHIDQRELRGELPILKALFIRATSPRGDLPRASCSRHVPSGGTSGRGRPAVLRTRGARRDPRVHRRLLRQPHVRRDLQLSRQRR